MSLTFDHGMPDPIRVTLFAGVVGLLADLTGPSGDADPTTQYGPVLRSVVRWPWDPTKLVTSDAGVEYFRQVISATPTPYAAVYIGDATPGDEDRLNPLRVEQGIRIHVYLVDGHEAARISGRLAPDNVDDRRPGLDATEDLVVSRLFRNSPDCFRELRWGETSDLFASPDFSIREIRWSTSFSYSVQRPRDPGLIDEVLVSHDVQGGGEPLVTQKKVFSP